MQIDQTTINDLSIENKEDEFSVFHSLDFTSTNDGRFYLKQILAVPLKNIDEIIDVQLTIKELIIAEKNLPKIITNGTIMVMERFYETAINNLPQTANIFNTAIYKIVYNSDFSVIKYSLQHFINFVKGLKELVELLQHTNSKKILFWTTKISMILGKPKVALLLNEQRNVATIPSISIINDAFFLRHYFKQDCLELIEIYSKIDAYTSLAVACKKFNFSFPDFIVTNEPFINLKGLYHLLLTNPTSYNIGLKKDDNFLFLTGANMAGKSTFIKAVGVAVYLAHIGMAVPAIEMQLSYFDGILSNIHVMDNIFKNESYFFNEVQRVKNTVEKINDNKKWLILIDELFKGTNIQDAMKCSTVVIEGLQKRDNAVFILSTHLYEIGEDFKQYPNIQFKYFETNICNKELAFNYQLKDGISNDRLGYLILEKEGVVGLLRR